MSWHYQIKREAFEGSTWFELAEVYAPSGWTSGGVPIGATPEEVIQVLERMLADAKKYPVLE
jgi:hypothetical protein